MLRRLILVMFCVGVLGLAGSVNAGLDPDLVAWWALDEGTGTVAMDGSGNGNDGTVEGGALWVPGMLGTALQFNGSDSFVSAPHIPFDERSFTIAMWINPDLIDGEEVVFAQVQSSSTNLSMHYRIYSTGVIRMGFYSNDLDTSAVLDAGNWYHITYWYDYENQNRRIYLNGQMEAEASANPYLGTSGDTRIGQWNASQWFNGKIDDVQVYHRALEDAEVVKIMSGLADLSLAQTPSPEDETTDVPREVVLSWGAGESAATHDVYFGTSFDDVNDGVGTLVSQGQTATTYDPDGLLDFSQTYYWRVDEVNAAPDNTVFKGETWSFTTEPFAYAVANVVATSNGTSEADVGPENTVNGSGLNADDQHSVESVDMWLATPPADELLSIQYEFDGVYKLYEMLVWNYNVQFEMLLGFGLKDVTVEYSVDGVDWTVLGDVELAQGTTLDDYAANTTIAFDGAAVKYVKLTVNSGYGTRGSYGLSEVRFMYIPATAREPEPADGAADVDVTTALTWRAGRDSVSHEVYFGADSEALELVGTPDVPSADPGAMDLDTTYYWKVDETTDTGETWPGNVWSFATQEYLVVDGFESYNDEDNLIYETWIDGWVNGTGSTVGHAVGPFAEQTIVHSGGQSMPLFYDNSGVDTAEADLDLNQDWTAHGVTSLSLYFYGDAANSEGQLFVRVNNTRIDYDGPAVNLTRPSWQSWNIDLATAGNVSNVNSLTIGIEGAGASGVVYIDDIRLYPEVLADVAPDITGAGDIVQGVPNDGVTTGNNDNGWPAAEYPDLAIDDDTDTKFLHFKGNVEPTGFQVTPLVGATIVTGLTFTTANDAAERDPTSFELYGSNDSIDGPYTLIASGDIVDFAGATAWERYTKTTTPITFDNDVAYAHYQVLFPTVRDAGSANSMQIGEVELLGEVAP